MRTQKVTIYSKSLFITYSYEKLIYRAQLDLFNHISDCTVKGQQGDGTERGTCEQNFLCHSDGSCQYFCTDLGSKGNGTSRGTCDEGETCYSDGSCRSE